MEIRFSNNILEEEGIDTLVYPVVEDQEAIIKWLAKMGYENETGLIKRLKRENFTGKKEQVFKIDEADETVIFYGTGTTKRPTVEEQRQWAGTLSQLLSKYPAKTVATDLTFWLRGGSDAENLARAFAEGFELSYYKFDKYKQPKKEKPLEVQEMVFQLPGNKRAMFKRGWELGMLMARGTMAARDLVNEPANKMTPTLLADYAQEIAKGSKNVRVKILDRERAEKMGMGAFLAVAQGSDEEPKFIHLTYKPNVKAKDSIALVGKGITFDTGGLNIKPDSSMLQMKIDMGGAATVLGIFSVIAEINPKVEVHGIIAACENGINGKAFRPRDIVTNMQGKTIEINHTDAEGRVTLADSLAYAQKQNVSTIVDLATLTGAAMVAVGSDYSAFFSQNGPLIKDIFSAANLCGEKMWQLPLEEDYKKLNDSKVADISNVPNSRYGGAITAALFLQEFIVDENVAWAHIDIAGPAYAEKPMNSYTPEGGVGHGVRTLLTWLKNK